MAGINPTRTLKALKKNATILSLVLRDVDQTKATTARDGADGWTVLEIMCHLNDFEEIFTARDRLVAEQDLPAIQGYDPAQLLIQNDYKSQNFADVFASWLKQRRAHVEFLSGLTDEQWARYGNHPMWGNVSVLEMATLTGQHDSDHIEQIIRALGLSEAVL
jgi:hypothetical protein